jgi:hypothetical protein|nr:MAG TPA: hypothetical protein [Caudoviricetes sp.]
MKRMTFREAEEIKINKSVQGVLFDGELVGYLYSSYRNLLAPIEEVFWSINLTKEQADKIDSKVEESEDSGFYQIHKRLVDAKKYTDLYVIAKRIKNLTS